MTSAAGPAPARPRCRLAQQLLQRCEEAVRPHLQRFLAAALSGGRTESELKDDAHALLYQVGALLGAAGLATGAGWGLECTFGGAAVAWQ